jgi:serine protease Do
MNKLITGIGALLLLNGYPALAQEPTEKGDKKEVQEIIVRKKGDKEVKVIVEVKGDEVLINGKPMAEYKDDDVTIRKRKVRVLGNNRTITMDGNMGNGFTLEGFGEGMDLPFWSDDKDAKEIKYTFLGVTTDNDDEGAKITSVNKESSAEKAGLKEGDIITKVGDKKIDGPSELSEAIRALKPNDEVKITYKRGGKEATTKAKLGEKVEKGIRVFSMSPGSGGGTWNQHFDSEFPGQNRVIAVPRMPRAPRGKISQDFNFDAMADNYRFAFGRPKLGLKIQDLEEGEGVKIINVEEETAAAKAGLKEGDIITEINGKKVSNTDDAREQLKPTDDKKPYSIKAKRGGSEMNFEVKIPKKIKTATF